MFSLSVSVLSYQRDSCGTARHLPFSSLLKSTASNLYFPLYRSSRLCCGSNGFPGYYGMYGFTWSISVRVRLPFTSLFYFFVILCHAQGSTILHIFRTFPHVWYLLSFPGRPSFNLGLFSSKVPFLLVSRSPLSLRMSSRKGPWERGCFGSWECQTAWKLMEMQIVN